MTPDNGGLSVGERFDRLETTLLRIEGKIENKVDRAELKPLYTRVQALEAGEAPLSKALLTQFQGMQQQITDLTLHGSQHAQDATSRIAGIESKQDTLEKAWVTINAARDTNRYREERAFRVWGALIASASFLALTVASIVGVITLVH